MGSSYFKNLGWAQLNGKWEPAVLFTLVYLLIVIFASATMELIPFIGVVLSSLVTIALYPMPAGTKGREGKRRFWQRWNPL